MKEKTNYSIKLTAFILIICLIWQILMPLTALAETNFKIELKTDDTELKAGDTVYAKIYVTGDKIASMSGYLHWDDEVFEAITNKRSIQVAEELESDEYGNWEASYSTGNNKMVIESGDGDHYEIPNGGLIAKIELKVKKDTETTNFSITFIEADGYSDYYGGINNPINAECDLPKPIVSYDVKYYANTDDNVSGMPSQGKKIEETDYTIAAGPRRTGYNFTGWNTKADGSGTNYAAGSKYTTDAELELYAKWTIKTPKLTVNPNGGVWNSSSTSQESKQNYNTTKEIPNPTTAAAGYTVRFDGNGGSAPAQQVQTTTFKNWTLTGGGSFQGTTYTFGETDGTLKANYTGNSITLPETTRDGYVFDGWYTSATGGQRVGYAGDSYTPNSNVVLVARWASDEHELTINANGGTYTGENTISGDLGSTVTLNTPTAPQNGGNTIILNFGFADRENGTFKQTQSFDKWEIVNDNGNKGTINGNKYTFGSEDTEIKAVYKNDEVNLPEVTRAGYVFDGWYTAPTGGTKITAPYYPQSNNETVYAHWADKMFTVTFYDENGTTILEQKNVREGANAQYTGETPTKEEPGYTYEFAGWDNESKLNNITENTQVKATYRKQAIEYTIRYVDEKNSDTTINPSTYTIEDETISLRSLPPKDGMIFDGWYTSPNGGQKITSIETSGLENIILYARWKEAPQGDYFRSEKYKVGEQDLDFYEEDDVYLDKIEPNTTVEKLKENCEVRPGREIEVYNGETKLNDDDLVGTNMKVVVKDTDIEMIAVVMGDVSGDVNGIKSSTGDGKITASDIAAIIEHKIGNNIITDEGFEKAADIDDNGKITPADLASIIDAKVENKTIIYKKPTKE